MYSSSAIDTTKRAEDWGKCLSMPAAPGLFCSHQVILDMSTTVQGTVGDRHDKFHPNMNLK